MGSESAAPQTGINLTVEINQLKVLMTDK